MSHKRAGTLALAGAASLLLSASLSGCVAAAIPVLAGGLLARSATNEKEPELPETLAAATVQATADDTDDRAATAREPLGLLSGTASATGTLVVATPGAAPAPDAPAADLAANPFSELSLYALERGIAEGEFAGGDLMASQRVGAVSAVLLDPTDLRARRKPCTSIQRTVLIDLDPGQSTFAPGFAVNASAGSAASLASLREAGIGIAWISGASAAYAGDVRVALKESSMDPEAKDTLLLMRYPGDRKQTRREDLASSSCLIAIAGDDRRDFDELFAYLVNPEAALGLELVIGDGWFLIPDLVLSTEPEDPSTANRKPAP